jgi:hypothetical protein
MSHRHKGRSRFCDIPQLDVSQDTKSKDSFACTETKMRIEGTRMVAGGMAMITVFAAAAANGNGTRSKRISESTITDTSGEGIKNIKEAKNETKAPTKDDLWARWGIKMNRWDTYCEEQWEAERRQQEEERREKRNLAKKARRLAERTAVEAAGRASATVPPIESVLPPAKKKTIRSEKVMHPKATSTATTSRRSEISPAVEPAPNPALDRSSQPPSSSEKSRENRKARKKKHVERITIPAITVDANPISTEEPAIKEQPTADKCNDQPTEQEQEPAQRPANAGQKSKPFSYPFMYRFAYQFHRLMAEDLWEIVCKPELAMRRFDAFDEPTVISSERAVMCALRGYMAIDSCDFSGLQPCVAVIEKVPQIPHKLLTAIGTIAPDKVSTSLQAPVPRVAAVSVQSSPSSTSEPVFTILGDPKPAPVEKPAALASRITVENKSAFPPHVAAASDSILPKRSQREQIKDKIYEDRLLRWMNVDIEPARPTPTPISTTLASTANVTTKKEVIFRQSFIPFKFEMKATPTCTCNRTGLPGDSTTLYQTCGMCGAAVKCSTCSPPHEDRAHHTIKNCALLHNLIATVIAPCVTGGPNTCLNCNVRWCADEKFIPIDCTQSSMAFPMVMTDRTKLGLSRSRKGLERRLVKEIMGIIGGQWTPKMHEILLSYINTPGQGIFDPQATRVTIHTRDQMISCQNCNLASYCSDECRQEDQLAHSRECSLTMKRVADSSTSSSLSKLGTRKSKRSILRFVK